MSQRDPESWFHELATHYVEAQVLFHLNQAGAIAFLAKNAPCTSAAIAKGLQLDEKLLETLMDYAYNVSDLLERDDQGRYRPSGFGAEVLKRYGRKVNGADQFNFFDVRVGAYGPVWQGLTPLLKREAKYGKDIVRAGEFAAAGLFTSSMGFYRALKNAVEEVAPKHALELGASTGLFVPLARDFPGTASALMDRSAETLDQCRQLARDSKVSEPQSAKGDLFDPKSWLSQLGPLRADPKGVLLYSVHFHEFMAVGEEKMSAWVMELRKELPGAHLLLIEQPRLPRSEAAKMPRHLWLYAQSNVLIHHVIGNGRILAREKWVELFEGTGAKSLSIRDAQYLGYQGFLFKL